MKSLSRYATVTCFLVASAAVSAEDKALVDWVGDTKIRWAGPIQGDSLDKLKRVAGERPGSLSTLSINSGGGEAPAAIAMADWLKQHDVTLLIRDVCISSCANYLVAAAPRVIVASGAVLGWHGGALQTEWEVPQGIAEEHMHLMRESLSDWCSKEAAFFADISPRREVTILGQLPHLSEQVNTIAWTYTLDDLKRLGWGHVHSEDKELATENATTGLKVSQLTLSPSDFTYRGSCSDTLDALRFTKSDSE